MRSSLRPARGVKWLLFLRRRHLRPQQSEGNRFESRVNIFLLCAALIAAALMAAGCGSNGKVERELQVLRAQNRELRGELQATHRQMLLGFAHYAARATANEQSLYRGLAATQRAVFCHDPRCQVPLGMPGAVWLDSKHPSLIRVTP